MPQAALIGSPRIEVPRWLAQGPLLFGAGNRRCNGDRHRFRYFVLYREGVGEVAVVALGPDVLTGLGLDELGGDADAVARFAQTAFEDIAHTQLAPNLFHIDRAPLVGEGRVACYDEQ